MTDYTPGGEFPKSEPTPKPKQGPKQEPKQEVKETAESLRSFLKEVFDLRGNVDKVATREEIKSNISFRGIQAYVLIASIIIASVGLHANSTAVVIGAMLLSPLMGPIIGFGYSTAVNDFVTLRRSLLNVGLMVMISLVTSYAYFSLIPGSQFLTMELRGRIEPTLLDVMIAISGGFAGIVGASSRNKNVNVIAGVAIATALMPPLCTVGYGLAVGTGSIGYKYYTGYASALNAFYLFFINSTFISISTFIFIKALRFPLAKYQDAAKRRRTNVLIGFAAILVMVPSVFIFYGILQESLYENKVQTFINQVVKPSNSEDFLDLDRPRFSELDGNKVVSVRALRSFTPEVVESWNNQMRTYDGLEETTFIVRSGGVDSDKLAEMGERSVQAVFESTQQQINRKDSTINSLQNQINRLRSDSIPFQTIAGEIKAQFPELDYFGYAIYRSTNFKTSNELPSYSLKWKPDSITNFNTQKKRESERRISQLLKARLKLDTLNLFRTN